MIGLLLVFLSVPVVQNLLSSNQQMNTSFDSFRLVNTYGAFGSITKERTEVVLEGTTETHVTPGTQWQVGAICHPLNLINRDFLVS